MLPVVQLWEVELAMARKNKYNTMQKVARVAYPAESKVSYCWCLPCVRSVALQRLERMTVVCP